MNAILILFIASFAIADYLCLCSQYSTQLSKCPCRAYTQSLGDGHVSFVDSMNFHTQTYT